VVFYFSQIFSLLPRTDKAVLAVNGFAADGNIFVKRLRQRLEVRLPLPVSSKLVLISYAFHKKNSGIGMLTQRRCPSRPSPDSYKLCSTARDFSHTMYITSLEV